MTRATTLALTSIALVGLPMLAFHRIGLISFSRATAPAAVVVAQERPFLAEGVALVEIPRPAANDGAVNVELAKLLAAAEPRSRNLHVDLEAAELGSFAGVIIDARLNEACHLAVGELSSAEGGSIRLAIRMHTAAEYFDRVGTYTITGGTGRFQGANGQGSVFAASAGQGPLETLSLTLDGTISY